MSTSPPDESIASADASYTCPKCGREFVMQSDLQGPAFQCEGCGEQFFLPSDDSSVTNDDADDACENPPADELDNARIRRHASLKRSLYRSRSYAIVTAVGFGLIVGDTLRLMINELRMHGSNKWVGLYSLISVVSGCISLIAARKSLALHLEAQHAPLSAPADAPDFSTLSDGSQIARHLHDIK